MDDERLRQQLHAVSRPMWPDARFAESLLAELEAELGLEGAPTHSALTGRRVRDRASSRLWLLVAAALITLALASVLVAGAINRQSREPTRLASVIATGVCAWPFGRTRHRSFFPGDPSLGSTSTSPTSWTTSSDSRAELVVTDCRSDDRDRECLGCCASRHGRLDLGDRFIVGSPYYRWPIFALVGADSPSRALTSLRDSTVCVVAGSVGEAWAMGRAVALEQAATVPDGVQVKSLHDDSACQTDVLAGQSAALVTSRVAPADLTDLHRRPRADHRRTIRMGASWPACHELRSGCPRVSAYDRHCPRFGHHDSTLRRASQQRFGGDDLTPAGIP